MREVQWGPSTRDTAAATAAPALPPRTPDPLSVVEECLNVRDFTLLNCEITFCVVSSCEST